MSSSPYHPKSNGKVESAVKIVKTLFKKAQRGDQDPWLALLDYRNTPTQGVDSSPVQRLMSRRTRTRVPVSSTLLHPKVEENVPEKLRTKRQKAKIFTTNQRKNLPPLDVGEEIRVASQKNKTWDVGKCVKKLSDRSYLVKLNGEVMRRNRQALRPKRDTGLATHPTTYLPSEESGPITEAHEEMCTPQPPAQELVISPDKIKPATSQSDGARSTESRITPPKDQATSIKRTRTRIIKAPIRYGDYVQS